MDFVGASKGIIFPYLFKQDECSHIVIGICYKKQEF